MTKPKVHSYKGYNFTIVALEHETTSAGDLFIWSIETANEKWTNRQDPQWSEKAAIDKVKVFIDKIVDKQDNQIGLFTASKTEARAWSKAKGYRT